MGYVGTLVLVIVDVVVATFVVVTAGGFIGLVGGVVVALGEGVLVGCEAFCVSVTVEKTTVDWGVGTRTLQGNVENRQYRLEALS